MQMAFLGLGTNLGDRQGNLVVALRLLAADPAISGLLGSSVYSSKPVGVLDQPDFLNMVLQIETTHLPLALLSFCLGIEAKLGRERRERWGPRIIDIDVLIYEQLPWSDEHLVLPHPRMHERSFVLTPLAEIAPDLILNGVRARDLATRAGTAGLQRVTPWPEITALAGIPPCPPRAP